MRRCTTHWSLHLDIWVPLARCNGSLSQEYLGWWGTWASVGLLVDKGCGLRAGCLGGDAGPTPTCSRLEPRWSLSRVHFWTSHSPTHRRPDQRFSGLSSRASSTKPSSRSPDPIRKSVQYRAGSPIFTMAEQILDQIRDVAEGQIVWLSSTYYKPYQATLCGNISWLTDHLHRTLRAKSSSRRCQPYS